MARVSFRTKITASQILVEQRTGTGTGGLEVTQNDALKIDFNVITDKISHLSLEALVAQNNSTIISSIVSVDSRTATVEASNLIDISSLDYASSLNHDTVVNSVISLEAVVSDNQSVSQSFDYSSDLRVSNTESVELSLQVSLDSRLALFDVSGTAVDTTLDTRLTVLEAKHVVENSALNLTVSNLGLTTGAQFISLDSRVSSDTVIRISNDASFDIRIGNFEVETNMSLTAAEASVNIERGRINSIQASTDATIQINNLAQNTSKFSLETKISEFAASSSSGVKWNGEFSTLQTLITFLSGTPESMPLIGTAYYIADIKSGYVISNIDITNASTTIPGWTSKYITRISDYNVGSPLFSNLNSSIASIDSKMQVDLFSNNAEIVSIDNHFISEAVYRDDKVSSLDSILGGMIYGGQSNADSIDIRLLAAEQSETAASQSSDLLINEKVVSIDSRISLAEVDISTINITVVNSNIVSLESRIVVNEVGDTASISSLSSRLNTNELTSALSISSVQTVFLNDTIYKQNLEMSLSASFSSELSMIGSIDVKESSDIASIDSAILSNIALSSKRTFIATFKIGALGPDTIKKFEILDPDTSAGISIMRTANFNFKSDIIPVANTDIRNTLMISLNGITLYPEFANGNIKILSTIPINIDGDYCLVDTGPNVGIVFSFDIMFLDKIIITYM